MFRVSYIIIGIIVVLLSISANSNMLLGEELSNINSVLSDEEQICNCYKEMYRAMSAKEADALAKVLDDSFVLIHMTGMKQPKNEFIQAVLNGTLNYYSYTHENLPVKIKGDTAVLIGQTRVEAAVFGGGKHTWRLQQECTLKKINGVWKITLSKASVY